jgi:hypothetical protein
MGFVIVYHHLHFFLIISPIVTCLFIFGIFLGVDPIYSWLVVSTPLKNMKVSWDYEIPNIWKVIKFSGSKPPTR